MSDNDHSMVIDSEAAKSNTHPEQDRDGCNFDAYIASDWGNYNSASRWLFTWHPGESDQPDGYWNGSQIG